MKQRDSLTGREVTTDRVCLTHCVTLPLLFVLAMMQITFKNLEKLFNHLFTHFLPEDDILWTTSEKFKLVLAYSNLTYLQSISQPLDEFILLCNFAGQPCNK